MFKIFKITKWSWDFLNLGLITLLSPIYFYKLAQTSLGSWDEAWYGAIARNILESGNLLVLTWNNSLYLDHPPAGFWIIALFESIFGANELGVRVGSAIFAMLGLYLTYLLGREIFSKTVGLTSALALSSAYWYISRARSGNLDIFLTVFFVLTFYLAIKSSKNKKFLILFAASLALLLLTKSLIPLTILPSLAIIFYGSKINIKDYLKPLGVFLLITLPWIMAQAWTSLSFFSRYLSIGAPGVGGSNDYFANFKQIKEYLHSGIGKWFWPGTLGVIVGPMTLNKSEIALTVFCLTFFAPFALSSKGHIWHLIPLYPFMILSFFGLWSAISKYITAKYFKNYQKILSIMTTAGMIAFSFYFSWIQIKRSWYEFIDIPAFVSDEEILSVKATEQPYNFYIDGADFRPTAVFYSKKNVTLLHDAGFRELLLGKKDFVLITNQWRLDSLQIPADKYKIIASDRDRILVIRK